MTNYVKTTNFTAKDSLVTGDPGKLVKGYDFDVEFDNLATAVATKADLASPSLTGTPTAPTATAGTATTQLATTAFVGTAVTNERTATATLTNKTLTSPVVNTPTISGGSISDITDLSVADGGTGSSTASGARANLDVPSTTGSGASGTWAIGITGNASTATSAGYATSAGNATTVDNGVYTNTTQYITGAKSFASFTTFYEDISVNSIGIGQGSGTGAGNTRLGYLTFSGSPSGDNNTAVGNQALFNLSSGGLNTAVGSMSLNSVSTGYRNVGIGYQALKSVSEGYGNVGIGYNTGTGITTGDYNISLGDRANSGILTSGSFNIYIGTYTLASSSSVGMEVVLNATGGNVYGKGTGTGYLVTGTGGSGSWYQGNNSSSWATTSDQRIKENFVDVTDGLSIINALNPVEFDYITTKQHDVGFKAQEYLEALPTQVFKHAANEEEKAIVGEDEIYGIQRNLDPYLVSAIKELTKRLEEAEAKLEALSTVTTTKGE